MLKIVKNGFIPDERTVAIEAPSLAPLRHLCGLFIDPQHTDDLPISAFYLALMDISISPMPGADFVTDAIDIDSVAAYLYLSGEIPESEICQKAADLVNQYDCLSGLPMWQPTDGPFKPKLTRALRLLEISKGKDSLFQNIAEFLRGDIAPRGEFEHGPFKIATMIDSDPETLTLEDHPEKPLAMEWLKTVIAKDGFVTLIGDGPGAAEVGYYYHPVVFHFQPRRGSVSISSWPGNVWANDNGLRAFAEHLNSKFGYNNGWGGQEYIIGSPRSGLKESWFEIHRDLRTWLGKE